MAQIHFKQYHSTENDIRQKTTVYRKHIKKVCVQSQFNEVHVLYVVTGSRSRTRFQEVPH